MGTERRSKISFVEFETPPPRVMAVEQPVPRAHTRGGVAAPHTLYIIYYGQTIEEK